LESTFFSGPLSSEVLVFPAKFLRAASTPKDQDFLPATFLEDSLLSPPRVLLAFIATISNPFEDLRKSERYVFKGLTGFPHLSASFSAPKGCRDKPERDRFYLLLG